MCISQRHFCIAHTSRRFSWDIFTVLNQQAGATKCSGLVERHPHSTALVPDVFNVQTIPAHQVLYLRDGNRFFGDRVAIK